MKNLFLLSILVLNLLACEKTETNYIGKDQFSAAEQKWLVEQEKLKCSNKYIDKITQVKAAMDASIDLDKLALGTTLVYEITSKTVEKDESDEVDIHRGAIKVIDVIGNDILLYVYDVENDGEDDTVDEEQDDKFVIYNKATNSKHFDYDFNTYCQNKSQGVSIDSDDTKLGKSLIFSYKKESIANNITKKHHALYSYPYFFSLYQFDETQVISTTKTKTITRRLVESDIAEMSCADLASALNSARTCDQRKKASLLGMSDTDCDAPPSTDPFIQAVFARQGSGSNCD